jgi:hypothetical protein
MSKNTLNLYEITNDILKNFEIEPKNLLKYRSGFDHSLILVKDSFNKGLKIKKKN